MYSSNSGCIRLHCEMHPGKANGSQRLAWQCILYLVKHSYPFYWLDIKGEKETFDWVEIGQCGVPTCI